ncbi:hypothetical protein ACFL2R_02660, partial [Patescibacteria group bacterium]
ISSTGWGQINGLMIIWFVIGFFIAYVLRAIAEKFKIYEEQGRFANKRFVIIKSGKRSKGELARLMFLWPITFWKVFSHTDGRLEVGFFPLVKSKAILYYLLVGVFWPIRLGYALFTLVVGGPVAIVYLIANAVVSPFGSVPTPPVPASTSTPTPNPTSGSASSTGGSSGRSGRSSSRRRP